MKKLFFNNKKEAMPEALKKGLSPDEKFIKQGKAHFLAAFDTSELAKNSGVAANGAPAEKGAFAWVLRIGIGVMAVLAIVACTSAYADTANVSVNSPLYPLKRLGENVQLALTPSQDKAQLQVSFAERRVAEIAELHATHPSSTLIAKLGNDLSAEVSSSLTTASDSHLSAKPLSAFCFMFSGRLAGTLALHPDLSTRFNTKCGDDASSTVSSTASSSSSLPIVPPFREGHHHGVPQNNVNGSSTVGISTSVISSTVTATASIAASSTVTVPRIPVPLGHPLPKLPF